MLNLPSFGRRFMTRQLLVPLKNGDRIKDIFPYVRDVAQPETTVVFLVHLGINSFQEPSAQLLIMNTGLCAKLYSGAHSKPLSNVDRFVAGESITPPESHVFLVLLPFFAVLIIFARYNETQFW